MAQQTDREWEWYAVVPAGDAGRLTGTTSCRVVTWGPFAALVGPSSAGEPGADAALHHDRVVRAALRSGSTVLPFRLGTRVADPARVADLLRSNAPGLAEALARVHGRVEMGVRARLDRIDAPDGAGWDARSLFEGLAPLRVLIPRPGDRRESVTHGGTGRVFDGRYLLAREAVDGFWPAADALRDLLPGIRLIATGPWAPYSFVDLVLSAGGAGAGREGEDLCAAG